MIKIIIDKILIRLKKLNDLIKIFFLKKKIQQSILNNKINSIQFFKLILKYILFQDKNEFVAIGYLKRKIEIEKSKKNSNPIEYLLPNQRIPLPSFFRNNISSFDINQCLGLGVLDNQQVYDKKLDRLAKQVSNLNCSHFISLISEKKPFHYLKYTHGFWDNLTKFAIKEYALVNGKDLVMQSHTAYVNHIFNNQFMNDIFQLVKSEKFLDAVKSRDIYFCPTTSNGSIGSKIEFKIMKELSKKNFLYQYSQIMLLEEFSKYKEITASNIFKKIICTDSLREVFLDKIKQYDLILICNHRAASKISKIYPNFKKIYCLPDHRQDLKHFANPTEFAHDVCSSVLSRGSTRPTLILSQSSTLSTFISYEILNDYQTESISLIDVGKPLQTLFSPEILGGGKWRDKDRLGHSFHKMQHLIPDDLYTELMEDTKIETSEINFKKDMDIELASSYQKKLF